MTDHADVIREQLAFVGGNGAGHAIAALDALEADMNTALASNAVFMSGEAYSGMHDAWHKETDRAEAAEAEVARLRGVLAEARDWIADDDFDPSDDWVAALLNRIDTALVEGGHR